MSTKVPENQEDREIDLLQISKKINGFLQRINRSIFNGIQFFIRNWIIVLILIIAGFGIGLFLDANEKSFDNEVIVTPNFDSVDYLYSKINLLEAKIESGDTVFLKEVVGIKSPKYLQTIKIKPIIDVYKFIKGKPENFELIKLLAEDGDVNKVIEDNITSKNYTSQKITLSTSKKIEQEKVIKPLMAYLNESEYFKIIQKEVYNNTNLKIRQNDSIIKQIDGILSNFSSASKYGNKNNTLFYNNENTQINDIIKTKDLLLNEQATRRLEALGFDKIIKDNSVTLDIQIAKFNKWNLKFLLPLIFILVFILLNGFRSFYKKQKALKEL